MFCRMRKTWNEKLTNTYMGNAEINLTLSSATTSQPQKADLVAFSIDEEELTTVLITPCMLSYSLDAIRGQASLLS